MKRDRHKREADRQTDRLTYRVKKTEIKRGREGEGEGEGKGFKDTRKRKKTVSQRQGTGTKKRVTQRKEWERKRNEEIVKG